jgi:phosphonate transport system substrate-binding protein
MREAGTCVRSVRSSILEEPPVPRQVAACALAACLLLAACGGAAGQETPTLVIGGIPDQDRAFLEERFGAVADHLAEELGIPVAYQPSSDYTALVTAFRNGDIPLSWFGGLTGVQARHEVPEARAIVQRDIDTEFRVAFIAHTDVGATSLQDFVGHAFTFGSESSTSGHLMPRHFLVEGGIDPEEDFELVGYSGSHDTTAQLVEAGSFAAGALSESVWDRMVEGGEVDLERVELVERAGPYYNYHWAAHPKIDEVYGDGTIEAIADVFLAMDADPAGREVIERFDAERFIATDNANYAGIEAVAAALGIIEEIE